MKNRWQVKLHVKYWVTLNAKEIDNAESQQWLRSSKHTAESKRFLSAVQNQGIPTRNC